jgi:hypothetical protein
MAKQPEQKKDELNFGITEETRVTNKTPFPIITPVKGDEYPIGGLLDVKVAYREITKDGAKYKKGDKLAILQFHFEDPTYKHIHIEDFWRPTATTGEKSKTLQENLDVLKVQLAHIYEGYMGDKSAVGIGVEAKNFDQFFELWAKAFNEGNNGKPVYKTSEEKPILVWLKLTSYKGVLGFPLYPNFLQKVVVKDGVREKPNFSWTKYDKVPSDEKPDSPNFAAPGTAARKDLKSEFPDFI